MAWTPHLQELQRQKIEQCFLFSDFNGGQTMMLTARPVSTLCPTKSYYLKQEFPIFVVQCCRLGLVRAQGFHTEQNSRDLARLEIALGRGSNPTSRLINACFLF